MKLNSIHHIAIITSDYEQTKHFYVDLLGFEIIRENYRPNKQDTKLDLQLGNAELEIFCVQNPPKRVTDPETCGLRHLAFAVDNLEEVVAELNDLGIPTEPIRRDDYTGKKLTFFRDPDGLPLELHE